VIFNEESQIFNLSTGKWREGPLFPTRGFDFGGISVQINEFTFVAMGGYPVVSGAMKKLY